MYLTYQLELIDIEQKMLHKSRGEPVIGDTYIHVPLDIQDNLCLHRTVGACTKLIVTHNKFEED